MRKQVSTNQEKEPQKDMLIKLGEQDIPEEQERLLQDVFEKLSCTQIHMYRNETNKILQIVLEDVYIDDKNVYCQSLYFCKNGNAEMGEEIFPNWYYEVLFYT